MNNVFVCPSCCSECNVLDVRETLCDVVIWQCPRCNEYSARAEYVPVLNDDGGGQV